MNIRKRQKLAVPVTVMPGDVVSVNHQTIATHPDGHTEVLQEVVFIRDEFKSTQSFDEVFIFDDIIEGRNAVGGGLIEEATKA